MSHHNRRYAPLQNKPKPPSIDKSLPLKNNDTRLKQIYEPQHIFTHNTKDKQPYFKKNTHRNVIPLTTRQEPQPTSSKYKPTIHNLNLAEIKAHNRYKDLQKDLSKEVPSAYTSYDQNARLRNFKQQPLTSRNREEVVSVERPELFKIKRKSMSGSLKKKVKEQVSHHLSGVNPTIPQEISYFEEGKKYYKEGKISQALKLFEMAIEKAPEHPQNYYYSALCNLTKQNYSKSYQFLSFIFQHFPLYAKKSLYLFAAISAKHSNMLQKALSLVSEGLSKYPDYIELYLYRARINEEYKEYRRACQDYEVVIQAKKDTPEVLLSCAVCLRKLGLVSNALSMLNNAFYHDKAGQFKQKILLERLMLNFQMRKLKECKKDILKLQQFQGNDLSEVYYYKGLIQVIQNYKKQALLSFEKCIRINNCNQSIAHSLVEITKSKIEDRDFYSALYHINRAKFLQISTPDIQKFRLFTEGVVFMMKRKINEGVDNFNALMKHHSPLGQYFEKLYYLYRAFGHFMQSKHAQAISDYQLAEKYHPKDRHIKYNQLIAEGIVAIDREQFKLALLKFDEAQKNISSSSSSVLKIEPFIYRAMTFIEKIRASNKRESSKADQLQVLEQIFIALKELDKAYDVNESNSNMLYLRSLIYMYLGKSEDGLQDIIKAISKSEENIAKYFFYRGLAHETLDNTKQALNDLNICINLDQKYLHAYFQRAKLLFDNQQIPKALEDLSKMKELEPATDIKLHQCCLYYISKDYDLAEQCLPLIRDLEKKERLQILIDLRQLRVGQAGSKVRSRSDKMICQILLSHWEIEEQNGVDLEYFNRVQFYNYLGIKYFHLNNYDEAINNFNLAIKEKSLLDLEQNINSSQHSNQQDQNGDIDSQAKQIDLHYLHFNLFLSYLQNHEQKKAYQIFIRDILPAKPSFLNNQDVKALSLKLFQNMKQKEAAQASEKQVVEVVMFKNAFLEIADFIEIELPNVIFRTKLCYLMPHCKEIHAEYSPKINPQFILSCLKISEVQNRPEPPWVKRNQQDLIFTDEIININVEFQTTEHDESNEEEEYEGDQDSEAYEREQGQSERENNEKEQIVFDPRKFREQMRLDEDIQRKLVKIMQRKKVQ